MVEVRDRIKELRRVPASELIPNAKNWRRHPQTQRDALSGILAEVGFADAVLARETPDGLTLVDGHLRADVMQDELVPVLVLDITEEEADKILLTLDPLAAMADTDTEALLALLEQTTAHSAAVNKMLQDLATPSMMVMPESDTDAFYLPNEFVENAHRRDERDASGVAPARQVALVMDNAAYLDFVQAVKAFGERRGLDNVSDIVVQGMMYASSS
jgi:hypothetical protein